MASRPRRTVCKTRESGAVRRCSSMVVLQEDKTACTRCRRNYMQRRDRRGRVPDRSSLAYLGLGGDESNRWGAMQAGFGHQSSLCAFQWRVSDEHMQVFVMARRRDS